MNYTTIYESKIEEMKRLQSLAKNPSEYNTAGIKIKNCSIIFHQLIQARQAVSNVSGALSVGCRKEMIRLLDFIAKNVYSENNVIHLLLENRVSASQNDIAKIDARISSCKHALSDMLKAKELLSKTSEKLPSEAHASLVLIIDFGIENIFGNLKG